MKRLSVFCKGAFLVTGFMVLSGLTPPAFSQIVIEDEGGGVCKTTIACSGVFTCSCPDRDCSSCTIPSGGGGCGHCSN